MPLEKLYRLRELQRRKANLTVWRCDRPTCDGKPHDGYPFKHGRSNQMAPPGDWLVWAFIAGRGSGKTRAMAEWVTHEVQHRGRSRVALVGRTPADVRDVMIEGESGLTVVGDRHGFRPAYEPSKRRLTWPNGAYATTYSAEVQGQLRGPQHDLAWCDEPAAWSDAFRGDVLDTAWNNLMLGLRVQGTHPPQCGFSTTPKRVRLVREVLERASTVKTASSTYDNLDNLAPSFRDAVLGTYEGTRIGRQELLGELLDDVEGALWTVAMFDEPGFRLDDAPQLARVVVAVDPATTSGEDSDETGIIVAARGKDQRGYVLADYTIPRVERPTIDQWARRVVEAYDDFGADRVIAEGTGPQEMIDHVLHSVRPDLPVKRVNARFAKRTRAEPIAALYEQGKVSHVGHFAQLEDQLTTWVPDSGESPDRLDALVWAFTELQLGPVVPIAGVDASPTGSYWKQGG